MNSLFCGFNPPRSEDGSLREEFPQWGLGQSPKRNPRPPNRKAIKKQESGSAAKPDSEQATSNRTPHPLTVFSRTNPQAVSPSRNSMESAPAAPSIIRLARLTASYLYTVSFSHALCSKKLFNNRPTSICLSTTVCVWVYHDSSSLHCALVASEDEQYGERWGAMAIGLWRISRPSGDALRWGTGLPWGCHPIPRLGTYPQTPISASRRLKAAFVCQPSVR